MRLVNLLDLRVPKGAYNTLRVKLTSERLMVLVLPEGLSASEAAQVVRELDELKEIIAGWKPS